MPWAIEPLTRSSGQAYAGRTMVDRDKDGRPIASPNAGAFLGPFTGVAPVPSDLLDRQWRAGPRKIGRTQRSKVTILAAAAIVVIVVLVILGVATPSTVSELPSLAFA